VPDPQDSVVHFRASVSKQVPVGGGVPHAGEQNSFGTRQPAAGEHACPVHAPAIVSKHPPVATHGPLCNLQAPACRRRQSLP